jgi:16S rRNA (uracil1498-N3)-methyltransferase
VRRLAAGERADLTDGAGTTAECVITGVSAGGLELAVLSRRAEPPPQPRIVVIQAIPKGDRGEQAVETMTEVGVDVIVPWAAERCVVRWRGDRADKGTARWRSTAVQAAKQSRRSWFPEVTPVATTAAVASRVSAASLALLLEPDAADLLAAVPVPQAGEVVLVIGPEGGIAPREAQELTAAGAAGARLGPTVLRAGSAGAVAAALVLSRSARWA